MAILTLDEIAQEVVIELGQVTGTSVQAYTEPQAYHYINKSFNHLFRDRFWPDVSEWRTITLSGTTGTPDEDLSDIDMWTDFKLNSFKIIGDKSNDGIPTPVNSEHLLVNGTRPLFKLPIPRSDNAASTKRIRFYPLTSVAQITYKCRIHPGRFDEGSDVVPLDSDLVMHGACWWGLSNDGINPSAAERERVLMDAVYQQLLAAEGTDNIGHAMRSRSRTMQIGNLL